MSRVQVLGLLAVLLSIARPLAAQTAARPPASPGLLRDFSASVEQLTERVSPGVVQILVTGYGPLDTRSSAGDTDVVIGPQRSSGSGAIIDADGYIITNAHVVAGARHVQVVLHRNATSTDPLRSLTEGFDQVLDARVVGSAPEIDLALLKADATGLHALPLANYDAIRQGQVVFAFGSPEGLRNSVTMGVISSVARQPDPDSPAIYVQTDAPINPGNSGGPLVNADGAVVGLNTFILTESGGSQGLGFAIPSAIIASAYPQLRKYGHMHRGLIGFSTQAITPALAGALGLARTSGVMVSDVMPDGPAERAGVQIKDVVTELNHRAIESVPVLGLELSRYTEGDTVTLGLLRGKEAVSARVGVVERPHPIDELAALADPEKNALPGLGIIGLDITDAMPGLTSGLRIPSGVLVVARTLVPSGNVVPLAAGDVIHTANDVSVAGLDALRTLVEKARAHNDLVLQIERNGQLFFVTCQIY